jgi:isoleucyl-tRNA synthetase
VLAHYQVYEFHPVVAKLQIFCSEDLGAFDLDILKDRLYTTAPGSHGRRSAQTALWHVTQAMLRWMAPFLSFTAEEAWKLCGPQGSPSIFVETYSDTRPWADAELLDKWRRIRDARAEVNREIEALRGTGAVGSSLQAQLVLWADGPLYEALASLGDDARYVFVTSAAEVRPFDAGEVTAAGATLAKAMGAGAAADGEGGLLSIEVSAVRAPKCERCWHYRADVGVDPSRPELCGRCTNDADLCGGASRRIA